MAHSNRKAPAAHDAGAFLVPGRVSALTREYTGKVTEMSLSGPKNRPEVENFCELKHKRFNSKPPAQLRDRGSSLEGFKVNIASD